MQKNILAVIPARGGSKSIPKKNIVPLKGKPLLAWSVEVARAVPEIGRIVVSSDDEEILSVAGAWGATPLRRPPELASDTAPTAPVLVHAIQALAREGYEPSWVVTLEPTQPFRTTETVRRAIRMAVEDNVDTLVTGVVDHGYFWVQDDGGFSPLDPSAPRRRQERRPYYRESGTVYVTRASFLLETGTMVGGRLAFLPVSDMEGMDINTPYDLQIARAIADLQISH